MGRAIAEIKKQCKENLDNMVPDAKGRFCSVCQTSVIDFTNKTPEEISLYFLNHKNEKVCGTYNRSVVKTDDGFYNFMSYLYSKKLKFLAMLISGMLVLNGCKTKKHTSSRITGDVLSAEERQTIENSK